MGGPAARASAAARPSGGHGADVEPEPERQSRPDRADLASAAAPRRLPDPRRRSRSAFVVLGFLDLAFRSFQDIIILFFLAWLMSFALLPIINLVAKLVPRAPGWLPVIIVYTGVVLILLGPADPARGVARGLDRRLHPERADGRGPAPRARSPRSRSASARSATTSTSSRRRRRSSTRSTASPRRRSGRCSSSRSPASACSATCC